MLAVYGSLPWSVRLRRSALQELSQTGRSNLCSRHQHGTPARSAWCVFRVTELCRISQVRRQLPRNAELVASATAHATSRATKLFTTGDMCWQ